MLRMSFLIAAMLGLSGCAAMRSLDSEVSSYSQWPAERKASSYVFERLPSQQARPGQQTALENAARPAVEAAGFTPAADEGSADFSIQLGARVTPSDRSPFDDPFWWHGGFRFGHFHNRFGSPFYPGWVSMRVDSYRYEREVAMLIRDRKTGLALYEARATNDATSALLDGVLPAMFEAALKDFPSGGINPRQVTVELSKAP